LLLVSGCPVGAVISLNLAMLAALLVEHVDCRSRRVGLRRLLLVFWAEDSGDPFFFVPGGLQLKLLHLLLLQLLLLSFSC